MTIQIHSVIPTIIKKTFLASTCFAALLAQSSVFAQTDQANDQSQDADDMVLEEVVVTGIRRSLDSAAQIKRNAAQVVDGISADEIGLFADNNIAEALQRIPGVQLEREAGEGYRISIRGLGPRFVRTTVNGRTALSTAGGEDGGGDDARGFTLNVMPSEVISRVTVEKSTQAKNLEGGIGGTLDLQTNRALDFAERRDQDFYISAAARVGYNDLVDKPSTRLSLFMNKKFSDNFAGFFGMVLDATDRADHAIESEAYKVRSEFTWSRLEPGVLLNGVPMTEEDIDALDASTEGVGPNGEDAGISMHNAARNSSRDYERDRQTYTTGLQWADGNWDVNFDWTYGSEEYSQYLRRWVQSPSSTARRDERYINSMTIDFGDQDFNRTHPTLGTMLAYDFTGARGDERVNTENRLIPRTQDIHVGGINVDWSGDLWNVNGDIGYASQDTVRNDYQVGTQLNSDDRNRYNRDPRFERLNGWFDATGPGGYPEASFTGVDEDGNETPFDPTDPGMYFFRRAWYTLTDETTEDTSARLDFTRELFSSDNGDLVSIFDAVMFGVAWNERTGSRDKRRFRNTNDPDLLDIRENDLITGYDTVLIENYLPDIPQAVHDFVFLDNHDPVFDPLWALSPEELLPIYSSNYNITEEVTSFYFQLPFSGGDKIPWRGNFGVRYVMTDQSGQGWVGGTTLSEDGKELLDEYESVTTESSYNDALPSFNIAWDLSDTWVLRLAANKAMTRADPIDMRSYLDISTIEDVDDGDDIGSGTGGNPDLDAYYTTSFDASFEWYPEVGGAYALGFFYKKIDGWIANGREDQLITAPVGVDGTGNGEFNEDDITDGIPGNGGDYYDVREEVYSIRSKVNTDGGTIQGFEAAFHTPFDTFSDGFWQYFGINGSLTYVDAEMNAVVPENGLPISLRGTSEWSGNLVGYFERKKFSARLAANYRSDYLYQEASDENRHDEWTEGGTFVDLNLSYRFNKHWLLRFTANNLTGKTRQRYWETAGINRFSDDRDNGQYYTLELRLRY
jgi:iron complex outermembrane receptor protein